MVMFKRNYLKRNERVMERMEKIKSMNDSELKRKIKKFGITQKLCFFSYAVTGVLIAMALDNIGELTYKNENFTELKKEYREIEKTKKNVNKKIKNLEKDINSFSYSIEEIEEIKRPLYQDIEKNKIIIKNLENNMKKINEEIAPLKEERNAHRKNSWPFYAELLGIFGFAFGGLRLKDYFEGRGREYKLELKSRKSKNGN